MRATIRPCVGQQGRPRGSCRSFSEGAPGDMANRIMLGEHRALEERRVVGAKRDNPERRRCGARLTAHHCMRGVAVIEIQLCELARSVVDTFRISAVAWRRMLIRPGLNACM